MNAFAKHAAPRPEPVPFKERRLAGRTRTVFRVARILSNDDQGLALLRNISDNGLSLSLAMPVEVGNHVRAQLTDTLELDGVVVWAADGACGLELTGAIDSAAVLNSVAEQARQGKLRPHRLQIHALATVRSEAGLQAARIENISQTGLCLQAQTAFAPGLQVKVLTASGIERQGVVRWTDGCRAGVRLLDPISVGALGSSRIFHD